MRRTPQTYSLKSKNTAQINLLQDKLFSKLQKLNTETQPLSRYEDMQYKLLNGTPDALSDLIYRAKGITVENQDKITKAKRQIRVSKKDSNAGTFLTGTGMYTAEQQQQQKPVPAPTRQQPEFDSEQMLKNMMNRNEEDDLAQLRRMIKMTDENLGGYSRQVHKIKKDVINAASQFKCQNQMSSGLSYKLNRLMESDDITMGKSNFRSTQKIGSNSTISSGGSNRKLGSLAKLRDNKFD